MSIQFASVQNATLKEFLESMATTVRTGGGVIQTDFKDQVGTVINAADAKGVELTIRTNPNGTSATIEIKPIGSKASALVGHVDTTVLASLLA